MNTTSGQLRRPSHPSESPLSPAQVSTNSRSYRSEQWHRSCPCSTCAFMRSSSGTGSALQNVHVFASTSSVGRQQSVTNFITSSTFVPLSFAVSFPGPSKITSLKIEQLCLTHDNLIDILQGCPTTVRFETALHRCHRQSE